MVYGMGFSRFSSLAHQMMTRENRNGSGYGVIFAESMFIGVALACTAAWTVPPCEAPRPQQCSLRSFRWFGNGVPHGATNYDRLSWLISVYHQLNHVRSSVELFQRMVNRYITFSNTPTGLSRLSSSRRKRHRIEG